MVVGTFRRCIVAAERVTVSGTAGRYNRESAARWCRVQCMFTRTNGVGSYPHIASQMCFAGQEKDGEVLISGHMRQAERAVDPGLSELMLARILVEPSAQLAVLGLHAEQFSLVDPTPARSKLLNDGDLLPYHGDYLPWTEQIVVLDEHLPQVLKVLDRVDVGGKRDSVGGSRCRSRGQAHGDRAETVEENPAWDGHVDNPSVRRTGWNDDLLAGIRPGVRRCREGRPASQATGRAGHMDLIAGHMIGHLTAGFRYQVAVGFGQGVQPDQCPVGVQGTVAAFGEGRGDGAFGAFDFGQVAGVTVQSVSSSARESPWAIRSARNSAPQ